MLFLSKNVQKRPKTSTFVPLTPFMLKLTSINLNILLKTTTIVEIATFIGRKFEKHSKPVADVPLGKNSVPVLSERKNQPTVIQTNTITLYLPG